MHLLFRGYYTLCNTCLSLIGPARAVLCYHWLIYPRGYAQYLHYLNSLSAPLQVLSWIPTLNLLLFSSQPLLSSLHTTMASLCDHCSRIPFSYLACPTASDIHKARHAVKNNIWNIERQYAGKRAPKDYTPEDFPLGTLSRIRKNKELCSLCGLIYHVIQQRGAPPGAHATYFLSCPDHIYCSATFLKYSFISESISDTIRNRYFQSYRLSLKVVSQNCKGKNSEDTTVCNNRILRGEYIPTFYMNIAQACHIDDFLDGRSPETGDSDQCMLFSGRQRPETVDLHLFRSWITICKTAHGMSCCFDENPSGFNQPQHCDR